MASFVIGVAGKYFGTQTIQKKGKVLYEEEKSQHYTATAEERKVVAVVLKYWGFKLLYC